MHNNINIIQPQTDKKLKLYRFLNLSKNIMLLYNKIKGENYDTNRIFINEEIGQMYPNKYLRLKNFIHQQLAAGKIMPEIRAKQLVKSGNLIYVNLYTRADGTQVSGYYRSK